MRKLFSFPIRTITAKVLVGTVPPPWHFLRDCTTCLSSLQIYSIRFNTTSWSLALPRNQKTLETLSESYTRGNGKVSFYISTPAMVHIWRNDHQSSIRMPPVAPPCQKVTCFLSGSRDRKGRDRGIPDGQKCIVDQHLRKKSLSTLFLWPWYFPYDYFYFFSLPWGIWVK